VTVLGLARAAPGPYTDRLLEAIAQSSSELGMTARRVVHPKDEASVDVMLYVGGPRAHAGLLQAPRRSRRIAWFGEMLPRSVPGRARTTRASVSPSAIGLRMAHPVLGPLTRRPLPGPLAAWRAEAVIAYVRLVNLEQARWCSGLVDRVVVTSRDRGRVLNEHGIGSGVVPFGYHPAEAGALVAPSAGERDIAVAVIGYDSAAGAGRRSRVIARLIPAIERLGAVVRLEGVWGAERDALLRRTRIVLDVQRAPGNFGGLRLLATLAAGAVLVTDTVDDPHPFEPGIDHVEAPIDGLVAAVAALLDDEPRRRRLVEAGQARLLDELSMRRSLERVLAE
jgi:hypothetical protein